MGCIWRGPFISPERLGAHPPLNLPIETESLGRVLALETLRLITLAPELDGALRAIEVLTRAGVVVSIGHTNATYGQAMAGVKAGARMFTHVFNAMPPMHHRAPGAAGAALALSPAMAALIPDGIHVHPTMLRAAWRAREAFETILTTDRVALSGTEFATTAVFGGTTNGAAAHGERAALLPDGTLAGSLITMLDGVRRMRRFADINLLGIAGATSRNPARLLKLRDRGSVTPRARADLLLLDHKLDLKTVFVNGREIG